ncbi:hypothetical protein NLM33_46280 [Bradyrhizobium sp. CCGUVB1N3]|nr:hypothetical protein [Bradyrhizobium sp. CCGUVB1N3]MCP3477572.1 hypothetical protein [Bradyrhizobium sp. CCGUVB1N3]
MEVGRRKLVTLRDAGHYIAKLPKAEPDRPEWQTAMEALILVAEQGDPTMFARIGIMRALNGGRKRGPALEANPTGPRRRLSRAGNRRPRKDHTAN